MNNRNQTVMLLHIGLCICDARLFFVCSWFITYRGINDDCTFMVLLVLAIFIHIILAIGAYRKRELSRKISSGIFQNVIDGSIWYMGCHTFFVANGVVSIKDKWRWK